MSLLYWSLQPQQTLQLSKGLVDSILHCLLRQTDANNNFQQPQVLPSAWEGNGRASLWLFTAKKWSVLVELALTYHQKTRSKEVTENLHVSIYTYRWRFTIKT
ncbi:Hypothetical predicted protein [Podarcis lilfordi]|uniref:Uncharacterized protein n=1 Tax=Podarcis lilfordi TaxID=74358 RepID=A0AA35PNV3_9SAUR|nr:Hypothetical predicted protein [Podarcis lilfordi]